MEGQVFCFFLTQVYGHVLCRMFSCSLVSVISKCFRLVSFYCFMCSLNICTRVLQTVRIQ